MDQPTGQAYRPPDLVLEAPAKINWYLEVIRRREDGYHELETVMSTLRWADELRFWRRADQELRLHVVEQPGLHLNLSNGPDNLVIRSLQKLREQANISGGMDVLLMKRLPLQAGLGGGSSDAATTLRAANHLWNLNWDNEQLEVVASQVGSDVPFFIRGGSALCLGRGEQIISLPGPTGVPCLVICPNFGLSTPAVFKHVDLQQPRWNREAFLTAFNGKSLLRVTQRMANRLQSAAEAINPRIALIHNTVAKTKPLVTQMTGSGSCVFAFFRTQREAQRAGAWLSAQLRDCRFVVTETVSRRNQIGNHRSKNQADERSRRSPEGIL